MLTKHSPQRQCVTCRTSGDKRGLLRVVRGADGTVSVDPSGKANGRGAYVCPAPTCVQTARKQRKLERSLRVDVPSTIYDELLNSSQEQAEHGPAA
jgi:uncharacterized protein